jgi:hypothetical protein
MHDLASQIGQGRLTAAKEAGKGQVPSKARDLIGKFREIVADPLNILIERHSLAGTIDDEGRVTLHNGIKVPAFGPSAYYGQFSFILLINRGVHEPLEEYAFQEMLKILPAAPTMIELGAYWGHYSMWLKRTRRDARVVLVEPEARHIRAGQANFKTNKLQGEFIQAQVGAGKFEVDQFLRERSIRKLDVLHADIQGAEAEMLAGAKESLASRAIDYLFISTHSDGLHRRVEDYLRQAGYRVEVSSDFGRHTCSYDGFIFASSPQVELLLPGFSPFGRIELTTAKPNEVVERLSDWVRPHGETAAGVPRAPRRVDVGIAASPLKARGASAALRRIFRFLRARKLAA